jgi:FAD synthetase
MKQKIRVMATGVFDLLHAGHLFYLEESKSLGDELVVVVAHDETVKEQKHSPIISHELRRKLIEALKPVDKAVIGNPGDKLKIVEELKPDIIALGYDQFKHIDLKRKLIERGIKAKIIRLPKYEDYDLNGTRKIIQKIADKIEENELPFQRSKKGDE